MESFRLGLKESLNNARVRARRARCIKVKCGFCYDETAKPRFLPFTELHVLQEYRFGGRTVKRTEYGNISI